MWKEKEKEEEMRRFGVLAFLFLFLVSSVSALCDEFSSYVENDVIYFCVDGEWQNNTLNENIIYNENEWLRGACVYRGEFGKKLKCWVEDLRGVPDDYYMVLYSNETVKNFLPYLKKNMSHIGEEIYGNVTYHFDCVGEYGVNYSSIDDNYAWCYNYNPVYERFENNTLYYQWYKVNDSGIRFFWNKSKVIGYEEDWYPDYSLISKSNYQFLRRNNLYAVFGDFHLDVGEKKEFAFTFQPNQFKTGLSEQKINVLFIRDLGNPQDSLTTCRENGWMLPLDPWIYENKGKCMNMTIDASVGSIYACVNQPKYFNLSGIDCESVNELRIVNQSCNGDGGVEFPYVVLWSDCSQEAGSDWIAGVVLVNQTNSTSHVWAGYYNESGASTPNYDWYIDAYWTFDETDDYIGGVIDYSGGGNDLTKGGTINDLEGIRGRSASFQGSGNNDYFKVEDIPLLNFSSNHTIAFFVETDVLGGATNSENQCPFSRGVKLSADVRHSERNLILRGNHDTHANQSQAQIRDVTPFANLYTSELVQDEWMHITQMWNNASGNYSLWENGLLKESSPLALENSDADIGNITIGCHYDINGDSYDSGLDGRIDEFFIFSRVLSEEEIKSLYGCNISGAIVYGDEEEVPTTTSTTSTSVTSTTSTSVTSTTSLPSGYTCVKIHSAGEEFYMVDVCALDYAHMMECNVYNANEYFCINKTRDMIIKIIPYDFDLTNSTGNWAYGLFTNITLWVVIGSLLIVCLLFMGLIWIGLKAIKP